MRMMKARNRDVYEEGTCYLIFEGLYGRIKYFETENYEIKIFDLSIQED